MHLLITAGPTREYIDTVRFISNASSGTTGYAIADAAVSKGHRVTLISGPVSQQKPKGVKVIRVISAADMHNVALAVFPKVDAVIATAAVADYTPAKTSSHKIKKTSDTLTINLVRTIDILGELGRLKSEKQVLIGFALEDRGPKSAALKKLKTKNLDAIVLNTPAALGSRRNKVSVYDRNGWDDWPDMTKSALARRLVRLAERLLGER